MQPRDFGTRVTNYNPEKHNTLNKVSFAKLDELQTLNINKESGIVQKIIWIDISGLGVDIFQTDSYKGPDITCSLSMDPNQSKDEEN